METHKILNNVEHIKKVIAYTRLLLAVTDTVQEEHSDDDDFKKAYQDFKDGRNKYRCLFLINRFIFSV